MTDDKDIKDAILDALRGDPTLSAYVKSFVSGEMDSSRKLFPYIVVGNIECRITPLTIGRRGYDSYAYTMEIKTGTRSLVPGEAFAGEKGILQLCEDIVSVVRPNDFGGIFDFPVDVVGVYPAFNVSSGAFLWTGAIYVRGERKVQRVK